MATEIYKPELVRESPLNLEEPGYTGEMPENKNGFIKMGMEEDVVIQRISRDLYKYAASGFRELFVNEAKACRHAAKKYNADPRIKVTLDPQNRKMVIEGIDSMGMTWEVFRDVYTVLGRSTNFDAEESGQFGFGRAAYTCLSEIMILEVYSRETGEKFTVMGKNGVGFQTGLPEPKMEKFGTRITLTLHKNIKYGDLWESMQKIPVMSGVYTVIDLKSNIEDFPEDAGKIEYPAKTAVDVFKDHPCDEAIHGADERRDWKIVEINSEDMDLVFLPKNYTGEFWFETYLVGVPIEYEYTGRFENNIDPCIVNIRNERKYMPTPDRERFSEKAVADINEKIDTMIIEYLRKECTANTIQEFMVSDLHRFIQKIHNTEEPIIDSLVPLVNISRSAIKVEGSRHSYTLDNLSCEKLLVMPRLIKSKILAVKKHDKGIRIFKPSDLDETPISDYTDLGIQTVDDYMKEHGLVKINPEKTVEIKEKTVLVYFWNYSESIKITEIGENTIVGGLNFSTLYDNLHFGSGNYKVTKHVKGIVGGISEDEFFENTSAKTYITTDGEKTGNSIMSSNKPVLLLKTVDEEFRHMFKSDKSITVFCENTGEEFEMSTLLEKNEIEYVRMDNSDLYPEKLTRQNHVEKYGLTFFSCLGINLRMAQNIREQRKVELTCQICNYINSIQDEKVRYMLINSLVSMNFSYCIEDNVFAVLDTSVEIDRHITELKVETTPAHQRGNNCQPKYATRW